MNIEIANRLVQHRKARGISQEELAAELGLSRQAVSKWERAEASPDTDNLIALARLYGVSIDTLLLSEEAVVEQPITVTMGTEPPEAPYIAAAELPKDEAPEDEIPHYSAFSRYERLSPGAQTVLKLGAVAIGVVVFFLYGILSLVFTGLHDAYSVICTAVYLLMGFVFHRWHPAWLIFLTVPIFYTIFQ